MKWTKSPFLGSAWTGSSTSGADLRATPSIAATIRLSFSRTCFQRPKNRIDCDGPYKSEKLEKKAQATRIWSPAGG
jgi:hypothetical protein